MSSSLLFLLLLIFCAHGALGAQGTQEGVIVQQKDVSLRNEPLKELFGLTLPPFKIPDIIIPPNNSEIRGTIPPIRQRGLLPTIKLPDLLKFTLPPIKHLPTVRIPDVVKKFTLPHILPTAVPKIPTLPHILPTALPKIPTIKVPTIPHILPTAFPKIPTIKIPTFPHILPTALPKNPEKDRGTPFTLPYPLPSDIAPIPFLEGNILCAVCESVVTTVKTRFIGLEKSVKVRLTELVSKVCDLLANIKTLPVLSMSCNLMKSNFISHLFDKLDQWENEVTPKGVCRVLPMCRK